MEHKSNLKISLSPREAYLISVFFEEGTVPRYERDFERWNNYTVPNEPDWKDLFDEMIASAAEDSPFKPSYTVSEDGKELTINSFRIHQFLSTKLAWIAGNLLKNNTTLEMKLS